MSCPCPFKTCIFFFWPRILPIFLGLKSSVCKKFSSILYSAIKNLIFLFKYSLHENYIYVPKPHRIFNLFLNMFPTTFLPFHHGNLIRHEFMRIYEDHGKFEIEILLAVYFHDVWYFLTSHYIMSQVKIKIFGNLSCCELHGLLARA